MVYNDTFIDLYTNLLSTLLLIARQSSYMNLCYSGMSGFTKLHMGLVVLVKKMSVLINFLLQNINLVSVLSKICPSFAGHVWQDWHISLTLIVLFMLSLSLLYICTWQILQIEELQIVLYLFFPSSTNVSWTIHMSALTSQHSCNTLAVGPSVYKHQD